jgi:hypothetical protein
MEKIKENIIHICFSECAGATLRHIAKKKQLIEGRKVIGFPDDISQGIIGNEINIEQRIEWWNKINKEDERSHSQQNLKRTNIDIMFLIVISGILMSSFIDYAWIFSMLACLFIKDEEKQVD